ncbi:MAG: DUF2065 domain-containing protein [Rhodobacteraceae bacterium]|uniref:DUF2065 family protein n=1 Tax=Amaricoccus sp. B4 TaxID=3368557 RepID=UPI000DAC2D40|nr:DUF2065 domain-containing protein [Paracoccaceae bacterium]
MIRDLLFGLGMVAIVEGLVLAVAPVRLQELLAVLARMNPEQRRALGLAAVASGVAVVWLVRG